MALAPACRIAGRLTRSASLRLALAWIDGRILASVDRRGRPYIAAPAVAGIAGRARSVARRKRSPRQDEWLARSTIELVAWLSCRRSAAEPGACTEAAAEALKKIDPRWPRILDRLERALVSVTQTTRQGFEVDRLTQDARALMIAIGLK